MLLTIAQLLSVISASNEQPRTPAVLISDTRQLPPFDSTADTVFDIIQTTDASAFACLDFIGHRQKQIWDRRTDDEPVVLAYTFIARFNDRTSIEIAVNPEFHSEQAARDEAMRYTTALGQIPRPLRQGIRRLSVHYGDENFHAGTGQIVIYAGTATQRQSYNHLEESIFHEAVHASWDARYRFAPGWTAAQRADNRFITEYAASSPDREDLAETALFAYALKRYPGRIPPADTEAIMEAVPHRLAFMETVLAEESANPIDDAVCYGSR